VEGSYTVDDTVGAYFAGIFVRDLEARIGRRRHEHGLDVKVSLRHERQGGIEGRYDAGDDDSVDISQLQRGEGEEIAQEDAPLIGGLVKHSPEAPVANEGAFVKGPNRDVCVSDVKCKQHKTSL
jgi:hypothetical protein